MKILIFGAGTLGSVAAARLAQAGADVTVLARGKRLADLRRDGIVLERYADGARTRTPVPVVDRLGPDDAYDLALVVMGSHQVPAVLPAFAANRRIPAVLFVGNSLGGETLAAALGKRVLRGFLLAAGTVLPDGAVRYAINERRKAGWIIGEPDGTTSPRLAAIAAVLERTGIGVEMSPAIDGWLKTHVAIITALGAGVYLAGGKPALLAQNPAAAALVAGGLKENLRVLQALGIPILPRGALVYLWIPTPVLSALLRRLVRSEDVAFAFAHAEKARPEIRSLLTDYLALARAGGCRLQKLTEIDRQFH